MAFTIISQDSFTQPATAQNMRIPIPQSADYFVTTNLTQLPLTPTPGVVIRGEWYGNGLTNANDGVRWKKASGSSAISIDTFQTATASNGFTYVTSFPQPGPAVIGTAITNANPAVVTMNNTFVEGQNVILYGTTGMLQISGMAFTATSVSPTGFTLLGLNASGFSAAATAVTARAIPPYMPVEPQTYEITGVTQAQNAVVTLSQAHSYVVGMKVEFTVPGSFGMVQLNNFYQPQSLPAVIIATTTYTITVNVNSSAFTAFAFPASSGSPTTQLFATVAPAGASTQFNPVTQVTTGYNFPFQAFRSGQFFPHMYLPAGAQSPGGQAGDTIAWAAYKMENGPTYGA
jgi:hypothetical protein